MEEKKVENGDHCSKDDEQLENNHLLNGQSEHGRNIEDLIGDQSVDKSQFRTVDCCGKTCIRVKRRTCAGWFKKFFWEGQVLTKEPEPVDPDAPFHERFLHKYRRWVALAIPVCTFHFFWWNYLIIQEQFYLFKEKWYIILVMVLGSLMAGMTSQGGGAVAFPTLTIGFGVKPTIARDFGLQVQSTGMGCATFAIFFMGVHLEWISIGCGLFGGVFGATLGFHWVDPYLTTPQKKLSFGAIWFSYAFALFLLNCQKKRRTFNTIPDMKHWKYFVLIFAGFLGGICTSFAGNGLDICIFSVLTLLFGISEKVATPTSVVMMASLSIFCWLWRVIMMYPNGVERETNEFITVSGGITTLMAPLGAVLGSHQHRLVLASYVYVINTLALVMALATVPLTPELIGLTVGLIVGGFVLFYVILFFGKKVTAGILAAQKLDENDNVDGEIELEDEKSV